MEKIYSERERERRLCVRGTVNICLCVWLKFYSCSLGPCVSFSQAAEEISSRDAEDANFKLIMNDESHARKVSQSFLPITCQTTSTLCQLLKRELLLLV